MLSIQIDNPELETEIQRVFGDDTHSLALAFVDFLQQRQVREDIGVSIKQLEEGEGIDMKAAIAEVRARYE